MTQPNFKEMTRKDLRKYILAHPTDDEAIRELVLNRPSPNTITISPDMPHEQVEALLRSAISNL